MGHVGGISEWHPATDVRFADLPPTTGSTATTTYHSWLLVLFLRLPAEPLEKILLQPRIHA